MAKLTVSVAGVDYDRTRALFDGTVPIAGCETICCAMSPEEAFHRAFRYQEFDITELSLSNSMALIAKGANAYVAIPVFPSRLFRHSSIYIRTDRGIERPEDLRGKVIGVPEYAMTAAVWIRGILQDEYGVRAADVKWRSGGLEQPGREARVALTLPTEIELRPLPAGETLAQHLDDGRIDGLISALAPSCFGHNPAVRRLFPDYRAAEEAYFERTRVFPIMHVVGIRRSLLEKHPWLAVNTYVAYQKAKEICYRQLETIGHLFTTLPWPVEEFREVAAVAREHGVPVHLDGARLFNACAATGAPATEYTSNVNTVMLCLSKGLGAPIGSVLCGSTEFIREAKRTRILIGGAWRQAGIMAAAGLIALREGPGRLHEDHANARRLAEGIAEATPGAIDPAGVATNILFVDTAAVGVDAWEARERLFDAGVLSNVVSGMLRLVTHLGVSAQDVEDAIVVWRKVAESAGAGSP